MLLLLDINSVPFLCGHYSFHCSVCTSFLYFYALFTTLRSQSSMITLVFVVKMLLLPGIKSLPVQLVEDFIPPATLPPKSIRKIIIPVSVSAALCSQRSHSDTRNVCAMHKLKCRMIVLHTFLYVFMTEIGTIYYA